MASYALWYVEATARIAREMHAQMMRPDGSGLYPVWLYFKPRGLAFAFAGEDERPDGFELATGERAPSNLTVEQLTMWVRKNTAGIPVLPGD